jgi:hypothetical protein
MKGFSRAALVWWGLVGTIAVTLAVPWSLSKPALADPVRAGWTLQRAASPGVRDGYVFAVSCAGRARARPWGVT